MTPNLLTKIHEIVYTSADIQMKILSDGQTYWLSQTQLQILFQENSKCMRLLLKKVMYNHPELKYNHSKRIPIIQYRKASGSDVYNEWVVTTNHYDLTFLQSLYQIHKKKEVSEFILFARRNVMKKVCVLGSCVCDIVLEVPTLPKKEQDIHIKNQSMCLGGCAYNVAHMLSIYNIPFTLFSPIGSGIYGDFVFEHLQKEQIDSPISRVQEKNGCCYCFVEEDGERTFLSHHGAEYIFQKEWFSHLNQEAYDTYYVCGIELEEISGAFIVEYLESLHDKTIYFAPGPRFHNIEASLMDRMLALSCILHVNEEEAKRMSHKETYREAAKHLHSLTNNMVLITRGEQGAYLYTDDEDIEVSSYPTNVMDTIGAGDGHLGAFIAEQKLGNSKQVSLQHANLVASNIVNTKGSSLSQTQFKNIKI